jgi:hypothetical protein
LGANFDNAGQGRMYGATPSATVQVATQNLTASASILGTKRAVYGATGQSIGFTDTEKDQLKK